MRNAENIPLFKTKYFFQKNIFPSAVTEWKSLDHNIRKVGSFIVFKSNILKFISATPNSVFNCENRRGMKLVTKMRAGLSHS